LSRQGGFESACLKADLGNFQV